MTSLLLKYLGKCLLSIGHNLMFNLGIRGENFLKINRSTHNARIQRSLAWGPDPPPPKNSQSYKVS